MESFATPIFTNHKISKFSQSLAHLQIFLEFLAMYVYLLCSCIFLEEFQMQGLHSLYELICS